MVHAVWKFISKMVLLAEHATILNCINQTNIRLNKIKRISQNVRSCAVKGAENKLHWPHFIKSSGNFSTLWSRYFRSTNSLRLWFLPNASLLHRKNSTFQYFLFVYCIVLCLWTCFTWKQYTIKKDVVPGNILKFEFFFMQKLVTCW